MGAGQRPSQVVRRTLPPARRGPLLALSPRGQALQEKQKSVVNRVPNPKWLLPNCNPIKVRLVYLSSLGLFITVQMAATFGRLSNSLPAARHAKLSSTESGPAPVRGHARRPLARRVLCLPPPCSHSPLRVQSWQLMEQVARSPLCRASSRAGHTWCRAPNYPCGRCSWEERDSRSPSGEPRGQWGAVCGHGTPCPVPDNSEQGAPWGTASNSGWKIKAEKIKSETCRKDSNHLPASVQGKPEELKRPQDHWRPRLTAGKQEAQLGPRDKVAERKKAQRRGAGRTLAGH